MSYEDKTLYCRECRVEFVFTAGEQEFYAAHGLKNEPGRCPRCRAARRNPNAAGVARTEPKEMHPVVCASCGAETTVPFLPRNDRPVYCSACFDQVRGRR